MYFKKGSQARSWSACLWRHVVQRAHASLRHFTCHVQRQPKVAQAHAAICREQDVLWLDISVQDALLKK